MGHAGAAASAAWLQSALPLVCLGLPAWIVLANEGLLLIGIMRDVWRRDAGPPFLEKKRNDKNDALKRVNLLHQVVPGFALPGFANVPEGWSGDNACNLCHECNESPKRRAIVCTLRGKGIKNTMQYRICFYLLCAIRLLAKF